MNQLRTLSREEVRALDRRAIEDYGIPGIVLMENAGRGIVDRLVECGIDGPIGICCGKGNNGGDGLVMARHLWLRGYDVRVFCWNALDAWRGDAATNAHILQQCGIRPQQLADDRDGVQLTTQLIPCDWVVDALLGTGATGAPRNPWSMVIERLNASPARRLAVDVPSGLDCDTGTPHPPTVRADVTVTLAAIKPGLVVPQAAPYVGKLLVADIGVPVR